MYRARLVQRFAQVRADEVFIAQLGGHGRAAQRPVHIGVEVDSHHVGAVIVERNLARPGVVATQQLEAVVLMVPVDGGTETDPSAARFGL